jgi:hypothetical protein
VRRSHPAHSDLIFLRIGASKPLIVGEAPNSHELRQVERSKPTRPNARSRAPVSRTDQLAAMAHGLVR